MNIDEGGKKRERDTKLRRMKENTRKKKRENIEPKLIFRYLLMILMYNLVYF